MFFGKNEKKRWHPGLVIAIGALAAIGGITLVERGKCFASGLKCKLTSMVRGGTECEHECD